MGFHAEGGRHVGQPLLLIVNYAIEYDKDYLLKWVHRGPELMIQNSWSYLRSQGVWARSKIQDPRSKIQDPWSKIQNPRWSKTTDLTWEAKASEPALPWRPTTGWGQPAADSFHSSGTSFSMIEIVDSEIHIINSTLVNVFNIIQDRPQGECNHDIVGGVVEVLVLGHAEQDQQVEDQNQGGQSRVAPHLRRTRTYFFNSD